MGRRGIGGMGGVGGAWDLWEVHRRGGVSFGHCMYTHSEKLQRLLVHFRSVAPSPQ